MVRRRTLTLNDEERKTLIAIRDHDPHPQLRERCAALIKIADGMSPYAVAREGLLRRRDPDSVYGWLTTYHRAGIAGLRAHLHGGSVRGRLRRRHDSGADAASPRSRGSG
jgi:hypothetical protein